MDLSALPKSVISDLSSDSGTAYPIYAHAAAPPAYRGAAEAHIDSSGTETADDWIELTAACIEHLSGYAFRQRYHHFEALSGNFMSVML